MLVLRARVCVATRFSTTSEFGRERRARGATGGGQTNAEEERRVVQSSRPVRANAAISPFLYVARRKFTIC